MQETGFWGWLFNLLGGKRERAMGVGQIMQQIWQQLQSEMETTNEWSNLLDLYVEGGAMFVILAREGKLYRAPVTLDDATQVATLGDAVEVREVFVPTRSRMFIVRQTDGRRRWFSISCTAVLNKAGEIDSAELFDSFVLHAQETGEYGYRTLLHEGETLRTGQIDFLARDGHSLITSGVYDDTELARVEATALAANPGAYEESIGYFATREPVLEEVAEGVQVPVLRHGILREISTLQKGMAASLFTRPSVIKERGMKDATKKLVRQLYVDAGHTEDEADAFIETVDETNRAIDERGLITRANGDEGGDGGDGSAEVPTLAAVLPPVLQLEMDDALRDQVVTRLLEDPAVMERLVAAVQAAAVEPLVVRADATEESIVGLRQELARLGARLKAYERTSASNAAEVQQHLAPGAGVIGVRLNVPRQNGRQRADDGDGETEPLTAAQAASATLNQLPKITSR